MSSSRGLLFIISAPSGTGKTTLAEQLAMPDPAAQALALLHLASRTPGRNRRRGL